MGFLFFLVFVFVMFHVLRAGATAVSGEGRSRRRSSSGTTSAWETVSKEWEQARQARLAKADAKADAGAEAEHVGGSPSRAALAHERRPLEPEPGQPPALERIRAELGGSAVGSEPSPLPPPLPPPLSVPGADESEDEDDDASSEFRRVESVEAVGPVDRARGGRADSEPEPRHLRGAASQPRVPRPSERSRPARALPELKLPPLPAPPPPPPLPPLQRAPGAENRGDGELLERLLALLEAPGAAEPSDEVRYSIASSLTRPAARLMSAVRASLAGADRAADKTLVASFRRLPMFGLHRLDGRHLEQEALSEALDALQHASPTLRAGVYGPAAELARALDPERGARLARALERLAPEQA